MGTWALVQIVVDIFLALGVFVVVMRMNRAPKDDPRLSRGLQLLQSKISVLEDLSDRTEVQVNQLTAILEQKSREVQAKVQLAEQHVHEIRVAMDRSLEVAKIFQDKIPHQEIIERQSTKKYVDAARMAHHGMSPEEIAKHVDLPLGEIEFITKVNREQLMFNEEQLPWWAKENASQAEFIEDGAGAQQMMPTQAMGAAAPEPSQMATPQTTAPQVGGIQTAAGSQFGADPAEEAARIRAEMELAEQRRLVENLSRLQFEMKNLDMQLAGGTNPRDIAAAFEAPKVPTESLQKLGEEFRRACDEAAQQQQQQKASGSSLFPPIEQLSALIPEAIMGGESVSAPAAVQPAPIQQAAMPVGRGAQSAIQASNAQAAAMQTATMQASPAAEASIANTSRATAQAKLQAALRSTAKPAAAKPEVSNELAAARAMAKEAAAPQPHHVVSRRPANGQGPVVAKVAFPRIDSET